VSSKIWLAAQGRAAANSEPAVVLVGGEAGIGKMRLVFELANRCRAAGGASAGGRLSPCWRRQPSLRPDR
jgi:hypothetical protein